MYFHLVYPPEFFAVASRRKLALKLFRRAAELMVHIDHEFSGFSTSPPFAFLSCLFPMNISLSYGKQLIRVLWTHMGVKSPSHNRAQTLTLCTLEHERKKHNLMLTRPKARGHFHFGS